MIDKSSSKSTILNKGVIKTFFGEFSLYSLREDLQPRFIFNAQSILILILSMFFFLLSTFKIWNYSSSNDYIFLNNSYDFFTFFTPILFACLSLDFVFSAIYLRPLHYIKHGYTITDSNLSNVIFNQQFDSDSIKSFLRNLFLRIVIYSMIIFLFTRDLSQNLNNITKVFVSLQVISFFLWTLLLGLIIVLFFTTLIVIGLGSIVEDYLEEGKTKNFINEFRKEMSTGAKEMDKLISMINDPNRIKIRKDYRSKLAKTLFKIRNFLDQEENTIEHNTISTEKKLNYVITEKKLAEELLKTLREVKCSVCYASLKEFTGELLVCPSCGQGGHKKHIEDWFSMDKHECPICKSNIDKNNFLLI